VTSPGPKTPALLLSIHEDPSFLLGGVIFPLSAAGEILHWQTSPKRYAVKFVITEGDDTAPLHEAAAWMLCDLLGRPAIEQDILQPSLHRRGNCVDVGEGNLGREAGGDVGGEANLGSKRLG
jgi:hypothetical protein